MTRLRNDEVKRTMPICKAVFDPTTSRYTALVKMVDLLIIGGVALLVILAFVRRYRDGEVMQEKPLRLGLTVLFVCTLPSFVWMGKIATLPAVYWLIAIPPLLWVPPVFLFVAVQVLICMSVYYLVARLLARLMLQNYNRLGGLLGINAIVLVGTAAIAAIPMYCGESETYGFRCSSLYGAGSSFQTAFEQSFYTLTGTRLID